MLVFYVMWGVKFILGLDVLTKENIKEPMRDIRRALLEADVSKCVVLQLMHN